MQGTLVEVEDVSMLYNISREKTDSLKEYLIRALKGGLKIDEFWALRNVSLRMRRGESLGIIGLNGSGKSTLLKLIAGVLQPAKGKIQVRGSIAPLIELGAGFDYDLTARENIYLNGAILGYSRAKMNENFDEIISFSELEDFVDIPIKNFSSGMAARLGFAIATISRPDILIADEILSVGDMKFQKKCESRISEIVNNGASVIYVSHSVESVKKICTKAAWLHKGELVRCGDADSVCDAYLGSLD
jgi:ABC-type polysaccharide/polyol phosphate transport system, ATPase component